MAPGFGCVQDTQDIYGVGIKQARTCCCDKPASIIESFQARGYNKSVAWLGISYTVPCTQRAFLTITLFSVPSNSSTTLTSTP